MVRRVLLQTGRTEAGRPRDNGAGAEGMPAEQVFCSGRADQRVMGEGVERLAARLGERDERCLFAAADAGAGKADQSAKISRRCPDVKARQPREP